MTAPPIKLPRVDPTGIVTYPSGFAPSGRPHRPLVRVAAALMLMVFVIVVVATTVLSLGRYCLTSDGNNTRALDNEFSRKNPHVAGAREPGP